MPYLRMFLKDELIDEVFIADHLLQSVIGFSIITEEKQKLSEKHTNAIRRADIEPVFYIDSVSSTINSFVSLKEKSI